MAGRFPTIRRGETFTGRKLLDALQEAGKPPLGGRQIEVTSSGTDAVVAAAGERPYRRVKFFAEIIASTDLGGNQWEYAQWKEKQKTGAGHDGWVDKPSGRTHTLFGPAFNFAEINNSASGIQGNGVDVDNLVGTFALQPVPDGRVVEMTLIRFADQSDFELWFDQDNGVDGDCK